SPALKTSHRNPLVRVACLLVVLVLSGLGAAQAVAQAIPSQQAPVVDRVIVRFEGVANVSEQVVRANMQVREGLPMDDAMIDRDIRSLYRTGLFEFIEVKREVLADGRVNLVFELTPKYRVLAVRFDGNQRVRDRRLEREV